MARLLKRHLLHRVTLVPFVGDTAEGDEWGAPVPGVPAYVEQKTRLVVDRRSTSPTSGQEITSSTFIVLLPDQVVLPRSRVTVWPGTPRERTSEVLSADYFDYDGTPSHSEIYAE